MGHKGCGTVAVPLGCPPACLVLLQGRERVWVWVPDTRAKQWGGGYSPSSAHWLDGKNVRGPASVPLLVSFPFSSKIQPEQVLLVIWSEEGGGVEPVPQERGGAPPLARSIFWTSLCHAGVVCSSGPGRWWAGGRPASWPFPMAFSWQFFGGILARLVL